MASTAEEDWASELDMLAAASGMADAEEARRPEPAPAVEGGSSFDDARVFLRQTVGIKSDNECAVVWDVLTNPNSIFTRRVEQPRLSRKAREKNAKKKTKAQTFKPRAVSVEQQMVPVVDYLQSLGLKGIALANTIKAHPPVLAYDVDTRIKPVIEYLVDDLECDNIAALVAGRPSVLGFDLDAMTRATGYLLSTDMSKEDVLKVVATTL